MKVYLVYMKFYDNYSYSGFVCELEALYLDKSRAEARVKEINKNIQCIDEKAYMEEREIVE